MKKLIRITTISESLNTLLKGQLKYLNKYYEVIGVAFGENLLQQVEKREEIRTVNVPIRREISLINDLYSLILLIKLFRKEKPDIVHANTPKGSLLGMIAAWICKVPIRIYTVTGLRFETTTGRFRKLLILMERLTCVCATNVIPEGVGVVKTLQRERITKKPLRVIHNGNINGIDVHYFDPKIFSKEDLISSRNKLNILKSDFVFIFVGRMVKDKGINELVNAFNRLIDLDFNFILDSDPEYSKFKDGDFKKILNAKLLLVGSFESELDPLYTETLDKINNNPNIISVGFQKDVRPYFAISNCLVFPSYREGFPNVVMQAGAMGLPSIVTDINGCNEIIINKINGVIIPAKDEEALYQAMKKSVEDPTLLETRAEKSRSLIISRYEQSDVWKALLDEYKKIETEQVLKNKEK